jgi:hypothetical protein
VPSSIVVVLLPKKSIVVVLDCFSTLEPLSIFQSSFSLVKKFSASEITSQQLCPVHVFLFQGSTRRGIHSCFFLFQTGLSGAKDSCIFASGHCDAHANLIPPWMVSMLNIFFETSKQVRTISVHPDHNQKEQRYA